MEPHRLAARELATVLAALRQWQMDWETNPDTLADSAYFEDHQPLTSAEIDVLCDRLNRVGRRAS